MTITALPVAPSRTDPTTFASRADALLGALATFVSEANALAVEVNEAKSNAIAAAATETKWVSGNAYTEGNAVWSPVDYKIYRAKGSTSGTTDPSSDTANWAIVSAQGDVSLTAEQTLSNKSIDLSTNTITGTLAEFNAALSDADLASLAGAETLTNKTLSGATLSGAIIEQVHTVADGGAVSLDPANGRIQVWTLGASRSPNFSGFGDGEGMTLMVADGSGYTITWPSMQWAGGGAPTLATSGYTVIVLWKIAGIVYGALVGDVA